MGPARDSGTSVLGQRFSEVQVRLEGLERDLSCTTARSGLVEWSMCDFVIEERKV